MHILVIGAGAWGTALAVHAANHANGHAVTLWARDAQQAAQMQSQRQNSRYLPGIAFPSRLSVCAGDVGEPLRQADLVILATPSSALTHWLRQLQALQVRDVPVAWLSKGFIGFDGGEPSLAHEIAKAVAPDVLTGVLSGPSFAQEVARGQPAALVAASAHASVRQALIDAFHGSTVRVYANDDVIGVEVGGAVKNVLAIATGLGDGLALGLNARAAIITRGLAEMTRLGVALGAKAETFMGLSGLGDLVLTATGDLSRNRQVGLQLAQGKSLQEAVDSLGHVAEGVKSASIVLARAQKLGVDMPITEAVVALLAGQYTPQQALAALMGRQARSE
jgi:glycerol-3-phosphate dehydrogenase (NAD(P)+)